MGTQIRSGDCEESKGSPAESFHPVASDEMVVSLSGRQMYMWRAVDGEGEVLEILVQRQRDKAAAIRLLSKLLRRQGVVPTVIVTDKLRSYGAALRQLGFSRLHEQGLRANKSCGELASAGSTTRAKDARLQISEICSTLRFGSCRGLQHIQCSTAFDEPPDASTVSNLCASILERCNSSGSINREYRILCLASLTC
jgi:hypothetical protein